MAEGHVLGGRARELVPCALALPRGPSAYARVAERVERFRILQVSGVVVQRVRRGLHESALRDARPVAEHDVLLCLSHEGDWQTQSIVRHKLWCCSEGAAVPVLMPFIR